MINELEDAAAAMHIGKISIGSDRKKLAFKQALPSQLVISKLLLGKHARC